MFFDFQVIERIRGLVKTNAVVKKGWQKFEEKMRLIDEEYISASSQRNKLLGEKAREYKGNKIFRHGNFLRNLAKETRDFALYYKVQEDTKMLNHVKEMIELVCSEEKWVFQGQNEGWRSDLWTGDIGQNIAIAFDTIKDELSINERNIILDSLYRKSFLPIYEEWLHPEKKFHALDSMGHNWWSVCVSGAGVVLLVMLECGRVEYLDYLDDIISGLQEWFAYPGNVLQNKKRNFGNNGDFIESIGYLDYALSAFTIFEEYYRRLKRVDLLEKIRSIEKVPNYYIGTSYLSEEGFKNFPFGDTHEKLEYPHVLLYFASRFKNREMLHLFNNSAYYPINAYQFYFYPDDVQPKGFEEIATAMVLNNNGYAVIRSGFEKDDTVFAIKTGEIWNHNHADIGSFILYCKGNEFIIDSGTCAYSKPIYGSYYITEKAHNVVVKAGVNQRPVMSYTGTKFEGNYPVFLDTPNYRYLLADCTGPNCDIYQRFYRHIIFLDHLIVMVDDLFSHNDGSFDWFLHYKGEAQIIDNTIKIKNSEELSVHNLFPEDKEYFIEKGYLNEIKNSENPEGECSEADYIKIKSVSQAKRIKFINVFVLPSEENEGIQIESVKYGNVYRVRLKRKGLTEDIYCNEDADGRVMHYNSHAKLEDLETDGFLCTIAYDFAGNVKKISLHNGSYLKYKGICYYSSLLKSEVVIKYEEKIEVYAILNSDARCYFFTGSSNDQCSSKGQAAIKVELKKGNNHFFI